MIEDLLNEINRLREDLNAMIYEQYDTPLITNNIQMLKEAGVDVCVAGSYVFGADDFKTAIDSLRV